MTYAVLGGGNTGQAIAGYLSLNKAEVKLYTRSEEKAEMISEKGLELSGIYSGYTELEAVTSIEYAIKDAKYIVVSTTAEGHKPILNKLKNILRENHTIIFIPGYWGALECKQILGNIIEAKNITVAETSAQPFISSADNEGSVHIKRIKQNVLVGTLTVGDDQRELPQEFLNMFPHLIKSKNVFETSLNNSNVVVHVPISLFNASRIDSAQKFEFYPEGVSPLTVQYIENVDNERIKIANLFDVKTKSILMILNEFYGTEYTSLYEALPSLFPEGAGPSSINHRYFTEDIPFGLVAISEIAKKADIKVPFIDSLIETASLLTTDDYRLTGINLEDITINELFSYGGLSEKI